MKKRFLLLPLIAAGAFFTLSSYQTGYDQNGTGSNTGTTGCGGGGCHSTGATTGVTFNPTGPAILLDSAGTGTLVTRYTPGKVYVIRFGAGNGTTSVLPKWGFQLSSIVGAAATPSPVQAGTFGAAPTGTSVTTIGGLKFFGHTSPRTSGLGVGGVVGAPSAVDSTSISWTAPVAGTGTITMFVAINMVTGEGSADNNDKWNRANTSFTEMPADHSGVGSVGNTVAISTFPNPVTSTLNLQLNNAAAGTYNVHVFDMTGMAVATQSLTVNGTTNTSTIDMNNFTAGVYNVVVEKDGVRSVASIVKQ